MITAAALCPAPPLLARELTGTDPVVPALRQACLDATIELLNGDPDVVAVVGTADRTRTWPADGQLDLAAYAPALRMQSGEGYGIGDAAVLPLPLGLGGTLLDEAGYAGRRELHSVGDKVPPGDCAALGARLAGLADRVALLVMADGSARRGPKAPGNLDERSVPFDAQIEAAVRSGELAALLMVDTDLARELMVTGRPAFQVLAGALAGRPLASEVRYCADPFGVAYLVASLIPGCSPEVKLAHDDRRPG